LIGRFVSKTIDAIVDASPADSMVRYGARIEVPLKVQLEIAVLKGIVSAFLMSHESRQPYYDNQRELLTELAEALLAQNGQNLDSYSRAAWIQAKSDAEKRRVIVDQVACLTDLSAKNLHERLTKAHA
jgi:dGTPase